MAFNHTVSYTVVSGERTLDYDKVYSGSGRLEVSEAVADGQTNKEITTNIDVSAVKSFYVVSDQNVTFETNDGSSPEDTIALKANVPYVWTTDSYDAFLLGADVTAIFITNSSGSTANIEMTVIQDVTP